MADTGTKEKITRSVDSLERIYAVVVALAVTLAVEAFMFNNSGNVLPFTSENGQSVTALLKSNGANLVAFIVTMVPFYHGMQRHLDRTYVEREIDSSKQGFLLLDFFIFFVESCLLLAFAASVTSGLNAILILMVLLTLDAIWAIIAYGIHYSKHQNGPWLWCAINIITVVLLWFCSYANWFPDESTRLWALALIACIRTLLDYVLTWEFYFPKT